MALIVKSSIDILPWTEIEKQKSIEEKEEFLNKKANEQKDEIKTETPKQKEEKENAKKEIKNSTESKKTIEKQDKKKEVNK
jgi:hypothetical protein